MQPVFFARTGALTATLRAGAGVWAWAGIGALAAMIADGSEAGGWGEGGAWEVWQQPKTEALLEGEPLRREADALYADARVALGFLR